MDLLARELPVGEVYFRLGGRELARCACVCRAWRHAAQQEKLWERLCQEQYPVKEVHETIGTAYQRLYAQGEKARLAPMGFHEPASEDDAYMYTITVVLGTAYGTTADELHNLDWVCFEECRLPLKKPSDLADHVRVLVQVVRRRDGKMACLLGTNANDGWRKTVYGVETVRQDEGKLLVTATGPRVEFGVTLISCVADFILLSAEGDSDNQLKRQTQHLESATKNE
eukprot:jgi/Chlat1/8747/Chrsp9S00895